MNDPDYAAKYDKPYGDDKVLRMGKQLVDARHIEGKGGLTLSSGFANTGSGAASAQIGVFGHPTYWSELRGGFAGVYSGDASDGFAGLDLGMRLQTPSRLTPFVGLGVYAGGSSDNHDDCDCEDEFSGAFAAVYPEVGAHFWWTGRTRLTLGSQYWLNSQGRDADFWLHSLSISFLTN